MFRVLLVDVVMIYLHTKFNMPISSGSVFIVVKLKTKETFYTVAMLYCILQKLTLIKVAYFAVIFFIISEAYIK
jgi:hypothetical protein